MAQHKRHPQFIKIITTDNQIVCINPNHVVNFQIIKDGTLYRAKEGVVGTPKGPSDVEPYTGSIIRFYLPTGQGLSYEVGKEISISDFDYIVGVLDEWVYMSQPEFNAYQVEKQKDELAKWNAAMAEEEAAMQTPVPGDPDYVTPKK